MMKKNTPGPWIYDETWGLIVTKDGKEIAACHSTNANGVLLSAAPELLDASKWAVGMAVLEMQKLEQMKLVKPDIGNIDTEYIELLIEGWRRILNQCQSAIDKAEGISQ